MFSDKWKLEHVILSVGNGNGGGPEEISSIAWTSAPPGNGLVVS
jgi:hypothetical protein